MRNTSEDSDTWNMGNKFLWLARWQKILLEEQGLTKWRPFDRIRRFVNKNNLKHGISEDNQQKHDQVSFITYQAC